MHYLLSFVIAIGILIFVHEFGHFLVAKLFGVRVDKFSLGFGPKLIGRKIGETEYLISAFPLGGYVKMLGEGEEGEIPPEEQHRSFAAKTPLQRIAIVAAGPLFNLFFAWLVFVLVMMVGFPALTSKINVVKDRPAARAGLQDNDIVTAINGKPVNLWGELQGAVQESAGRELQIKVKRGDAELSFRVVPETMSEKDQLGETITRPVIGVVSANDTVTKRFAPGEAVIKGSELAWDVTRLTTTVLVKLVEGKISLRENLGGPLRIADVAGQQAAAGIVSFVGFLAGLSINLGILNLLPIPILDGGHIAFNLWELIFRRPVTPKAREIAQQIGLMLLIALMLLAIYLDVDRYVFRQWLN